MEYPDDYNKFIIIKSEYIDNCCRDSIFKYEYNNSWHSKISMLIYLNKIKLN